MESIDVTDEQYERLDAIRESLAEEVPYGHVRARDAVQYLLDEHDGDGADVSADSTRSAGADDSDGSEDTGPDDGDDDPDDGDTDDDLEADDGDETGEDDADDANGDGGDEDRLSAMMNLLDTHDDKWEQADSEETRYVVDLPDGGTEEVQTKDDVKAILFKNY